MLLQAELERVKEVDPVVHQLLALWQHLHFQVLLTFKVRGLKDSTETLKVESTQWAQVIDLQRMFHNML